MTKAFVIGDPISHSKSPNIHKYWLSEHSIEGSYEPIHVKQTQLASFLERLRDTRNYAGGNVTIPHKEATYNWLLNQENSDEEKRTALTPTAKKLGAVNTLYFDGDILTGDNTDGYGFIANLDDKSDKWRERLSNVIIIGAGGAARAVASSLYDIQKQLEPTGKFIIANRTIERAKRLIDELDLSSASSIGLNDLPNVIGNASLLVNTSSLGLSGSDDNLPFGAGDLNPQTIFSDIVYNPLITPFLNMAQQSGAEIIDGLGMLLHQAAPGFEHWFDQRPNVSQELRNIVLSEMGLLND